MLLLFSPAVLFAAITVLTGAFIGVPMTAIITAASIAAIMIPITFQKNARAA